MNYVGMNRKMVGRLVGGCASIRDDTTGLLVNIGIQRIT